MEINLNNKKVTLLKKDRNLKEEAPAIRIKMLNEETKVLGMMASQIQVFISLPYSNSLNEKLLSVVKKYEENSFIYIISANKQNIKTNEAFSSLDFKEFALKMGLYIDDTLCAKSIFIINKDGEIIYKQLLTDLLSDFDLKSFESKLEEAINFKKKGHTHENWMST